MMIMRGYVYLQVAMRDEAAFDELDEAMLDQKGVRATITLVNFISIYFVSQC